MRVGLSLCCLIYISIWWLFHLVFLRSRYFFFFKQKTAYEMRISDWSSDVCSSDLGGWRIAAGKFSAFCTGRLTALTVCGVIHHSPLSIGLPIFASWCEYSAFCPATSLA